MEEIHIETLPREELAAIADLWKRSHREISTRFGGVSMVPTIPPGTSVRITCGGAASPGDVLVFFHRGEIVVHRLLRENGQWILTRGDANPIPDHPVATAGLIGRVTAVERENSWQSPPAWTETGEQKIARGLATLAMSLGVGTARAVITLMWAFRGTAAKSVVGWRSYGPAGFLARVWSRTGGAVFDVDIVRTGHFVAPSSVEPVEGYRFERVDSRSPRFVEAARLLRVDAEKRDGQEAFVAIDTRTETVAACAFSDRGPAAVAHNRGVVSAPSHRGRSLAGRVLLYQAAALAREGAPAVEYHVNITNRAARRMFHKLGAVESDWWIIAVFLRRYRIPWRVRRPQPIVGRD